MYFWLGQVNWKCCWTKFCGPNFHYKRSKYFGNTSVSVQVSRRYISPGWRHTDYQFLRKKIEGKQIKKTKRKESKKDIKKCVSSRNDMKPVELKDE